MEEPRKNTNLESYDYNHSLRIFYLSTISFCLGKILNKSILISLVDKWIINIHHFYGMNPLIVRTKIMRMGKEKRKDHCHIQRAKKLCGLSFFVISPIYSIKYIIYHTTILIIHHYLYHNALQWLHRGVLQYFFP